MEAKKKYKVVYIRKDCIGAAACVAIFPKRWFLNADGKADLIDGVESKDEFVLEIDESEVEQMKESAECCPVNVIHIYDPDGKQLI